MKLSFAITYLFRLSSIIIAKRIAPIFGQEALIEAPYQTSLMPLHYDGTNMESSVTNSLQQNYFTSDLERFINFESLESLESQENDVKKFISESYYNISSANSLQLARAFITLAKNSIKKGGITQNLKCYNDAAMRLQYTKSILARTILIANTDTTEQENILAERSQYLLYIHYVITGIWGVNPDDESFSGRTFISNFRQETKENLRLIEKSKNSRAFANNDVSAQALSNKIANNMREYLATLFSDAEVMMGKAPCNYALIGLGSMALRQITPYSDFEFAILTENENYRTSENIKIREYFTRLTYYVNFKVIMLGETPLPYSEVSFDPNDLIKPGVQFDFGGKTPLGRISGDKPYTLIRTVDQMLEYLKNKNGSTEHIDKNLPYVLETSCYVYGSANLAIEYKKKVKQFLLSDEETSPGVSRVEMRAVKRLKVGVIEIDYSKTIALSQKTTSIKGNLDQFVFEPWTTRGREFDVKQEIYRPADRFIYNLGFIHGVVTEEGGWNIVDRLFQMSKINEEAANNLKAALDFATILRLRTYSHYNAQRKKITIDMKDNVSADTSSVKVYYLSESELSEDGSLFRYYYTVLPLIDKLKTFCIKHASLSKNEKDLFFFGENFYNDNHHTKGRIYLRLHQLAKAKSFFKEALQDFEELFGNADNRLINVLNDLSLVCLDLGETKKGLAYLKRSLSISEIFDGNRSLTSAYILNSMGSAYSDLGQEREALGCLEKSLSIRRELLGEAHEQVATVLNNIGLLYFNLGEYNKALQHHNQSLSIRKQVHGGELHYDVAVSLNNIGLIYNHLSKYETSLIYYNKSLSIRKDMNGNQHFSVAAVLNNIAIVYCGLAKYNEALQYAHQSLFITEKTYGLNHLDTARDLNTLGVVCYYLGQYSESWSYLERSLIIRKNNYDNTHKSIVALSNMGYISLKQKQYEKALGYLKQALSINEQKYGKEHDSNLPLLSSIGSILNNLEQHRTALKYYVQALPIVKKMESNLSRKEVAVFFYDLGMVYAYSNQQEQALEYLMKSLGIYLESDAISHETALTYQNIGGIHHALGHQKDALKYSKKAFNYYKKLYGTNHISIAQILNNLGMIYRSIQQPEDAFKAFKECLAISKELPDEDGRKVTTAAFNNIALLYSDLKQSEKAINYYKDALKLSETIYEITHPNIATTLENIGTEYANQKKYEEALKYFQKKLDIYKINILENTQEIHNIQAKINILKELIATNQMLTITTDEEIIQVAQYDDLNNVILPLEHEQLVNYPQTLSLTNTDYDSGLVGESDGT